MVFSRKGSSALALGFFITFLGVILPHTPLFLSGAAIILFVSINWFFFSSTENALFAPDIIVSRDIKMDSRQFNTFINKKIPVTVSIKNNTFRKFGYAEITDIVPESFEIIGENSRILQMDEKSELEFSYFVIPIKRGEYEFPGVNIYVSDKRGFFFSEKFFRLPVKVTVYPSIEDISIDIFKQGRNTLRTFGIHSSRQIGIGTDFAGIREYVDGDSFKKIEWKSTARFNKPMTREFESEVTVPSLIFLDVSPSMDSGKTGHSMLDYSIRTAAAISKYAIDNHDPVGIYTFSDRLVDHLPQKTGKKQLYMILRTLTKINPDMVAIKLESDEQIPNNPDFDDILDSGLIKYDSEYTMVLWMARDFLCRSYPDVFDKNDSSIDLKIKEHVGKQAGLNSEEISVLKWNNRIAKRYLLEFCMKNGLQLPLKFVDINKEKGLKEAIKTALTEVKGTSFMVILSDWEGLDTKKIKNTLKLARLHHHNILVLAPFSPWFEPKESKTRSVTLLDRLGSKIHFFGKERKDIDELVEEMYSLKYSNTRKKLTKEFSDIGIPVLSLGPEDFIPKLLSQLIKMKQQKIVKV